MKAFSLQGAREPTKVPGSQIIKPTKAPRRPLFVARHFCPFWTTHLDYALGADMICTFALGAEAAFYWCLFQGKANIEYDDQTLMCCE